MNSMKDFDELNAIKDLISTYSNRADLVRINEIARINVKNESFPIHSFELGTTDPKAPVLGLFGGVHGLEKVGTQVVITYLASLLKQLSWDEDLQESFQKYRIVSIPMVNPWGVYHHRRANPNDVDLMRNAPCEENLKHQKFLLSGHRYSKLLPWYRGELGAPMEQELQTVVDFVEEKFFQSPCAISVDFHSGFGLKDRLWYPYSRTYEPFSHIAQMQSLEHLFDETHPYHVYKIEPTSASYTISGDVWDYLYDRYKEVNPKGTFLPLTLEMGSWTWVKKNPLQVFMRGGLFNPIKAHRHDRTMRRHITLIKFLYRAVGNNKAWA